MSETPSDPKPTRAPVQWLAVSGLELHESPDRPVDAEFRIAYLVATHRDGTERGIELVLRDCADLACRCSNLDVVARGYEQPEGEGRQVGGALIRLTFDVATGRVVDSDESTSFEHDGLWASLRRVLVRANSQRTLRRAFREFRDRRGDLRPDAPHASRPPAVSAAPVAAEVARAPVVDAGASFDVGLDLGDEFVQTLSIRAADEVLRAIEAGRSGRELVVVGGTHASYVSTRDDRVDAISVQLVARYRDAATPLALGRLLDADLAKQTALQEEVTLIERSMEYRVGAVRGGSLLTTWTTKAADGTARRLVSAIAHLPVADVVHSIVVRGPDDASFGVVGARAILASAFVATPSEA